MHLIKCTGLKGYAWLKTVNQTTDGILLPFIFTVFVSLPACNVLYINSVDTESLTGPQAISRAVKCTRAQKPCPSATAVHFKVSSQGITLTDNQRRYTTHTDQTLIAKLTKKTTRAHFQLHTR